MTLPPPRSFPSLVTLDHNCRSVISTSSFFYISSPCHCQWFHAKQDSEIKILKVDFLNFLSAGIYLLKFNSRNIRTRCEICSKLTIKTPEQHQRFGVFIVNFEHISHLVLVSPLLTLNKYLPTHLVLVSLLLTLNKYLPAWLRVENFRKRKFIDSREKTIHVSMKTILILTRNLMSLLLLSSVLCYRITFSPLCFRYHYGKYQQNCRWNKRVSTKLSQIRSLPKRCSKQYWIKRLIQEKEIY